MSRSDDHATYAGSQVGRPTNGGVEGQRHGSWQGSTAPTTHGAGEIARDPDDPRLNDPRFAHLHRQAEHYQTNNEQPMSSPEMDRYDAPQSGYAPQFDRYADAYQAEFQQSQERSHLNESSPATQRVSAYRARRPEDSAAAMNQQADEYGLTHDDTSSVAGHRQEQVQELPDRYHHPHYRAEQSVNRYSEVAAPSHEDYYSRDVQSSSYVPEQATQDPGHYHPRPQFTGGHANYGASNNGELSLAHLNDGDVRETSRGSIDHTTGFDRWSDFRSEAGSVKADEFASVYNRLDHSGYDLAAGTQNDDGIGHYQTNFNPPPTHRGEQNFGHPTAFPEVGPTDDARIGTHEPELDGTSDRVHFHPEQDGYRQQDDADFDADIDNDERAVRKSGGRRGLLIVGALIAAIGAGGALGFAYKYSSGESSTGEPVVISKTGPVKAKPENAGGKQFANQSKSIYDRLSDKKRKSTNNKNQQERLVARDEPVQQRSSGLNEPAPANTPTLRSDNRDAQTNGVSGVRRVQTVRVNPDGTFSRPAAATPSIPAQRTASAAPVGAIPGITVNGSPLPAATVPASQSDRKQVKTRAIVPPKPTPVASRQQAVASLPKRTQPTKTSGRSAGGGGYLVQIAARRNRLDALAAFADLQQRYNSLLSGRQPDIQEADLGSRGTWYRLRIGPPTSRQAAANLCQKLKSSGLKDCLIKSY